MIFRIHIIVFSLLTFLTSSTTLPPFSLCSNCDGLLCYEECASGSLHLLYSLYRTLLFRYLHDSFLPSCPNFCLYAISARSSPRLHFPTPSTPHLYFLHRLISIDILYSFLFICPFSPPMQLEYKLHKISELYFFHC